MTARLALDKGDTFHGPEAALSSAEPGGRGPARSAGDHSGVACSRKADAGADLARKQAEAAYRFMAAMCGDRPGFEEASRALFAGDLVALRRRTGSWPENIRVQVHELLGDEQTLPD